MLSIKRSEVPGYLRKGSFFEALDCDDEGAFEVPSDCFKTDTRVESQQDLECLLCSLRFWGAEALPLVVLKFILEHHQDYKWILFCLEFPERLTSYREVAHEAVERQVGQAIRSKLGVDVVRWLHENGRPLCNDDCASAAVVDDVTTLKYLHENGFKWDEVTLNAAIKSQSMQTVAYALECLPFAEATLETCVSLAMEYGSAKVLTLLLKAGFAATDITMSAAVRQNQLECVKVLHEHGCGWTSLFARCFLENDAMECLEYAYRNGYDLLAASASFCFDAVLLNRPRCLKFAHEQGCVLEDELTPYIAARHGNIECLRYVHEQGCEWGHITYCAAWEGKSWPCRWYVVSRGCPSYTQRVTYVGLYSIFVYSLATHHFHLYMWALLAFVSAWLGLWTVNAPHVLRGVVSIPQRDVLRVFFALVPVVITGWFLLQVFLLWSGVILVIDCQLY